MKPLVIYCYDAWCGWCYGFSPVISRFWNAYKDRLDFEVLSGGMILPEQPVHIRATANYILESYKRVEELTGIRFGEDYLWHIRHPDLSDWYPDSRKSAAAMCIFKEYYPDLQVPFAAALQVALHQEGRDLDDDEAYRHLLEQYQLPVNDFYAKLHDESYQEKAAYEFALVKQLQVTGFPAVYLQTSDTKFYALSKGYTDYNTFEQTVAAVLAELGV